MRRMVPDTGKAIKCSFENVGRVTNIYVPIKNLDELPITFDLIITNGPNMIVPVIAFYSVPNDEVYG